jgi:hypothetical protein
MVSWIFGIVVWVIGVLNVFFVHAVPGVVYFLLSFLYFPPINVILKKKYGHSIPVVVKIILGVLIITFTLGVSDLGNMIDSFAR